MADTEVCYTGGPAPPWLDRNAWYIPVAVPQEHIDKMPRIALHRVELKVHMCCKKCAEIVAEEIRYLGGVFNVVVDQKASKVTVTGRPDPERVLKRARKVDKHATFWPQPPPAPPVVVVVEETPAEPEKPAEEEKPAEPEKPAEEEKPAEPEKPAEEEKPAEPEKPAEEEKPAEPEKPAEEEKPAELEKPKEEEKPAEPEKPKEEEKPAELEKPKEEEKPAEPEKPKEEADTAAVQFPPFQYSSYEGYPGPFGLEYRPSQDYQRLYPSDYNYMGYYGPAMPMMNPNYLKHVKIAY